MPKAQRLLSCFKFSKRRPRLSMCCLPLVVLSFKKTKQNKKKKKKGNFTQKRRKHLHTCEPKRPNINSWHFIPCDNFIIWVSFFSFFFFLETNTRGKCCWSSSCMVNTHTSEVQVAHAMKLFFFFHFFF